MSPAIPAKASGVDVNLRKTLPKLDRLLRRFRFVSLEAALAQCDSSRAKWPAFSLSGLSE